MPSPSLQIRRLVVDGELGLDLRFHKGLNVVSAVPASGDPRFGNKAGKTALVELIQYGLGRRHQSRERFHFAPILDEMRRLYLEIEANGRIVTIERSLRELTARATVREGALSADLLGTRGQMIDIPELSGVLLELLGIPEESVKMADGSLDPLSFPVLMRAFVLHQDDSFGAILDKVQPDARRADIIGFLSGIIPVDRFPIERELSDVELSINRLEPYVQNVTEFLAREGVESVSLAEDRVADERRALSALRGARQTTQLEVQRRAEAAGAADGGSTQASREGGEEGRAPSRDGITLGVTDQLRAELIATKHKLAETNAELASREQERARLADLLESLRTDVRRAAHVQTATDILSTVNFDVCPRCLLDVTPDMRDREQHGRCGLCARPLQTTSDSATWFTPATQDIEQQIAEVEEILRNVDAELEAGSSRVTHLREREAGLSAELDAEMAAYVAPLLDEFLAQSRAIAAKEGDVARAQAQLRQARALAESRDALDRLRQQQEILRERLDQARMRAREQLGVFGQVYQEVLRRVNFPNWESARIEGSTLLPYIGGSLYVHTGTAYKGLATVCYHLALLDLAVRRDTYFPRCLVVDSPAVGDLNDLSHDRLLRYLAALPDMEQYAGQAWQVILTTRRMVPELRPYEVYEISGERDRMLLRRRAIAAGAIGGQPPG